MSRRRAPRGARRRFRGRLRALRGTRAAARGRAPRAGRARAPPPRRPPPRRPPRESPARGAPSRGATAPLRPAWRTARAAPSPRARTTPAPGGRAPAGRRSARRRAGAGPPSAPSARSPSPPRPGARAAGRCARPRARAASAPTAPSPRSPATRGTGRRPGAARSPSRRRRTPARPSRRPGGRSTTPRRRRSSARRRRSTAAARRTPPPPAAPPPRSRPRAVRRPWSPSYVRRDQVQHRLHLERRQPAVLGEHERGDPGDGGRREAVSGRADRAAAEPGDVDVDATREELDRRIRIGEEDERVVALVAPDRDDRREPPRVRLDRHVVRGGDQHRPLEVGRVGELAKRVAELSLRRREAHVDDVVSLLDRPAETGEQRPPGSLEPGAEHAHRVDLAFRRERADDARARGAVPAEIALLVLRDDRLSLLAERDHDCAVDLADKRMLALDPAVEDADANPRPRRALERPL